MKRGNIKFGKAQIVVEYVVIFLVIFIGLIITGFLFNIGDSFRYHFKESADTILNQPWSQELQSSGGFEGDIDIGISIGPGGVSAGGTAGGAIGY